VDERSERLRIVTEALDAAEASLLRARAKDVPRKNVPSSLARFGPFGAIVMRAYNTAFLAQREVMAEQNDAMVGVLNALREVVRAQQALQREIDPPRR